MKRFMLIKLYVYFLFFTILLISSLSYTAIILISKQNFITEKELEFTLTNYHWIGYFIGLFLFFILGFISGNFEQKKGMLAGFSSAVLLIICLIAIKIINDSSDFSFFVIIKYLSYLLISVSGGIIGVNFKCLSKRFRL